MRLRNRFCRGGVVAVCLLLSLSATAVGGQSDQAQGLGRWFSESSVMVAYGSASLPEGHYEPISLLWRLGLDLERYLTFLKHHAGRVALLIEPKLVSAFNPETDIEFGVGFGLKYQYPLAEQIAGYVLGVAGPHFISVQTREQTNGFVFCDDIGAGLTFWLSPKSGVNLEYRFRHLSNAGIEKPNNGIDAHLVALGYTVFF